jgi:hypothetical protein
MSNPLGRFLGFLSQVNDSMVKVIYPRDFEQQDSAYQLAWIDQHLPALQQRMKEASAIAKTM